MQTDDPRPFRATNDLTPFLHHDDGAVTMCFDMAVIQSRMRLDDPIALDLPYSQAMMGFLLLNPEPASILVIGLGGGSLSKYCHAHFPHADITTVEINPHVIAMRDDFKVPPDSERFRVVAGDGAAFIVQARAASYDVILVDGFGYEGQPDELCSMAFYKACRKALAESGVLVVNLLDKEPECSRLIGRVWQVFGEGVIAVDIECGGNRIAMAGSVEVFRQCAIGYGRRWSALPEAHKETLRPVTAAIEYELEPWMASKPKPAKSPKAGKPRR